MATHSALTAEPIRNAAHLLDDSSQAYTPFIQTIVNKDLVLLGEATHRTQEFYQARIDITKQLILHHGLNAIAIEGDWPSAYRVNRYVRWQGADKNPDEAPGDFKRSETER